jgi:hypothetical protein
MMTQMKNQEFFVTVIEIWIYFVIAFMWLNDDGLKWIYGMAQMRNQEFFVTVIKISWLNYV